MKEHFRIMGISTVYWIWGVVLLIAVSLGLAALYGVYQNIIRNQQTHTTGFIQAQVDHMSKNLTAFDKNVVEITKNSDNVNLVKAINSQQMGIVLDTWEAYDLIPQDAKDAVPSDIMQFLATHPRNWTP